LRPIRLDVMLELDFAGVQPTTQESAAVAEAAAERARREGDFAGEAVARVVAAHQRLFAGEAEVEELEGLARAALPVLEKTRNHRGLAHVWHAIALGAANMRGQFEDCARAAEQALEYWRLAGVPQTNPGALDMALTVGPRPADEALEAFDKAMPEGPHPYWLGFRAWLLGMQGRLDEAESLATDASERAFEVRGSHGVADWTSAEVAALAGDHQRASHHLERLCEFLEGESRQAELSTFASRLGVELCALGRMEDAEGLGRKGRELGDEHDAYTQALWRQVLARVAAHRGDHAEAERLAREALARIHTTDSPQFQADAYCDLAQVLEAAGRRNEAIAAWQAALDRYERKQIIPLARNVRERLAAIQPTQA
jgi:tetratricopeptide (TPR) repeat protein